MYAHQVIDDLRGWKETVAGKFKAMMVEHLLKSVSFHIGDAGKILDTVRHSEIGQLLWSTWPEEYYRPPFELCWIDWFFSDGGKQGALVVDGEGELVVWPFVFVTEIKAWRPMPSGSGYVKGTRKTFGAKCPEIQYPYNYHDDTMPHIRFIRTSCTIVEKALILLNCKNITTEIIKAPEKLNKKRRKNGKQEIFDYHILNIVVPSPRRGQYQDRTEPLFHNRVHLCRGHFKEYTPEHPLFGRYTGLYWWQPHVRGQNKAGIVTKGYRITPPT